MVFIAFVRLKESIRKAWKIFKEDPFDPRLRTHKIQRLSAHYGRTVYAAEIEGDLRVTFYVEGENGRLVDCRNARNLSSE